MVLPSALHPGSASPLCSKPIGVQLGPPSLSFVRDVPSGRILSVRTLKQLLFVGSTCATTNRIQSSLDHAMSAMSSSSATPLALTTFVGFAPFPSTVQIVDGPLAPPPLPWAIRFP